MSWRLVRCLVLLLLASCTARTSREGRQWMAGRALDDVEQCMGIPEHTAKLDNGTSLAQWTFKQDTESANLPLAALALLPLALPLSLTGNVSVGNTKLCTAIATVYAGRVEALRYTGETDSLFGRDTACAPIVRGCVRMWEGKQ